MIEIMLAGIFKKLNNPGDGTGLVINPGLFDKLVTPSTSDQKSSFGNSLAVSDDGSTIVAGSPEANTATKNSAGEAYIFFKQADGSYLNFQGIYNPNGGAKNYFGATLDVSGDGSTIVVGAPIGYINYGHRNTGTVHVFIKQADGNYLRKYILIPLQVISSSYFGWSVSITLDSSTIVVCTKNHAYAYVFTKQPDGNYLETQRLSASDGKSLGNLIKVSGDGSTIVTCGVITPAAYIFTRQPDGNYLETQRLIASDGAPGGGFGYSLDLTKDGSTILIGFCNNTDSGAVYGFKRDVGGSYYETQKLLASDGAASDYFGFSVAVSINSLAVGAPRNPGKGAVFVY